MTKTNRNLYLQRFHLVENFLANGIGDALAVKSALRPLLEGNLRMRFPSSFSPQEWLGDFLQKIRNSSNGELLYEMKPLSTDLSSINDYTKVVHHDDGTGGIQINTTELHHYSKKVVRIICGLPVL
jgi:wobble nucleotide-excising tRNase